jgi:hypothetical protein
MQAIVKLSPVIRSRAKYLRRDKLRSRRAFLLSPVEIRPREYLRYNASRRGDGLPVRGQQREHSKNLAPLAPLRGEGSGVRGDEAQPRKIT